MLETQIIILVILVMLSAFFSASEAALISLSMIKVNALVKQKKKGSETLLRLKQKPQKLITTILIGNNLVNVAAAAIATVIFTNIFGSQGLGIATGVMTFILLVFGEITPKNVAIQNAERLSLIVARPIEIMSYVLFPVVKVLELISRGISKLFSGQKKEGQLSEEELKTMVMMGKEEGILSTEMAEMMHNIIEFEGTRVTEIMTTRTEIKMVDGDQKLRNIINYVVKTNYSKYPVYIQNRDKIIGILDVDDVLKYVKNKKLDIKVKNIIRPVYFVPESKEIDELLTEFEGKDVPMAIIVDEYGYVSGLVTVEDILEEIVGEIFDKSKIKSVYVRKLNENTLRVDAKAPIKELDKFVHLDTKEGYYDTVGGFIQHKLKRIPQKGETIKLKKVTIEIDEATDRAIKMVKIIKH